MASNDLVILQDTTFDKEVLKSDIPVLVDFWATWCGPCKAIAPTVEELAKQYKGKVKVAKMDVDEHQQVPQQYGIRSIPTLLVFKGGRVVDTIIGAVSKGKIEDALKKATG
ncbi:MAG TPA: thioredoxin [Anaeromyxobacteraceae bacterium]|nr:thioredoxin [Anaeromyxobacteraceae bacterium]